MKNAPFLLSLITLSLFVAGCSQVPTDPARTGAGTVVPAAVQLQAERTSPTTILLTLRNDTGSSLGYNLCATAMERRSGNGWTVVPSDGACTMELRILATGATATYTRQIPAALPPGDYRFVTQVESPLGSRQERIVSNTITVS